MKTLHLDLRHLTRDQTDELCEQLPMLGRLKIQSLRLELGHREALEGFITQNIEARGLEHLHLREEVFYDLVTTVAVHHGDSIRRLHLQTSPARYNIKVLAKVSVYFPNVEWLSVDSYWGYDSRWDLLPYRTQMVDLIM